MARNAFWMLLSVGIGIVQGVAVTYVMSRYLGLVAFGQLGLIVSCTSIVLFASGSVVSNVLRESARGQVAGRSLVVAAMLAQVLLAAPVLVAALGALWLLTGERALLGPAAILGVALMMRTALGPLVGLHLGRERMEWQLLDSAQLLLSFAALLVLVVLQTGLYALPLASLVGASGVGMVSVGLLGRRISSSRVGRLRPVVGALAVPILLWAAVSIAQQVQWSVEPLLAPALMEPTKVGLFIAGGRLLPGIRSVASAMGLVLLPTFVRAAASGDPRALSDHAARSLRYLVPAGLLFTVALFSFSSLIVAFLYPRGFEPAALILRRLSVNVIPILLHWQAMCLLFAADKSRPLLAGYGIAFGVRLILGTWFGSAYGAMGLATAQVLSDWTLALTLHAIVLRVLRLGYAHALVRNTLCACAALAVLVVSGQRSLPLAAGGALAVYGLGCLISPASRIPYRHGESTTSPR